MTDSDMPDYSQLIFREPTKPTAFDGVMTGTAAGRLDAEMLRAAIVDLRHDPGAVEPYRMTLPPAVYRAAFDGVDLSTLTVAEAVGRVLDVCRDGAVTGLRAGRFDVSGYGHADADEPPMAD